MMRIALAVCAVVLSGCVAPPQMLPLGQAALSSGQFAGAGTPVNASVGRYGGRLFRAVDGLGRVRSDTYCFAPLAYTIVSADGRAPLAQRRVSGTTYEYQFLLASTIDPADYTTLLGSLPPAAAGAPSLVPCTAFFQSANPDPGLEHVLQRIGARLNVTSGLTGNGTTILVVRVRGDREDAFRATIDAGHVLSIPATFALAGNDQSFQAVIAVAIL